MNTIFIHVCGVGNCGKPLIQSTDIIVFVVSGYINESEPVMEGTTVNYTCMPLWIGAFWSQFINTYRERIMGTTSQRSGVQRSKCCQCYCLVAVSQFEC